MEYGWTWTGDARATVLRTTRHHHMQAPGYNKNTDQLGVLACVERKIGIGAGGRYLAGESSRTTAAAAIANDGRGRHIAAHRQTLHRPHPQRRDAACAVDDGLPQQKSDGGKRRTEDSHKKHLQDRACAMVAACQTLGEHHSNCASRRLDDPSLWRKDQHNWLCEYDAWTKHLEATRRRDWRTGSHSRRRQERWEEKRSHRPTSPEEDCNDTLCEAVNNENKATFRLPKKHDRCIIQGYQMQTQPNNTTSKAKLAPKGYRKKKKLVKNQQKSKTTKPSPERRIRSYTRRGKRRGARGHLNWQG